MGDKAGDGISGLPGVTYIKESYRTRSGYQWRAQVHKDGRTWRLMDTNDKYEAAAVAKEANERKHDPDFYEWLKMTQKKYNHRGKGGKTGKSGVRGVTPNLQTKGLWIANIFNQGTKYILASNYKSVEEASNARAEAEKQLGDNFDTWYKEYKANRKQMLKIINNKGKGKAKKDITGQKYGRLTVVGYDDKGKWWCQCDCGTIISVKSNNLKRGNTTACKKCGDAAGALKRDIGGTQPATLYNTPRKNNTSGVTGVYRNKRKNQWAAEIMFKKKYYFLGYYDKLEDAARARKEAEKELHGDFLDWYAEAYPEKWEKMKDKISHTTT